MYLYSEYKEPMLDEMRCYKPFNATGIPNFSQKRIYAKMASVITKVPQNSGSLLFHIPFFVV